MRGVKREKGGGKGGGGEGAGLRFRCALKQRLALGALLCGAEPNARLERSLAVMAGLIVADGAGAPFEFRQFRSPGGVYTPDHGIKGAFGLPEMAGTDDSSMAMAFLHSLYCTVTR